MLDLLAQVRSPATPRPARSRMLGAFGFVSVWVALLATATTTPGIGKSYHGSSSIGVNYRPFDPVLRCTADEGET